MTSGVRLNRIHHAAIICQDYDRSRKFYRDILGLTVVAENYRTERGSWKLDLALLDGSQIELFSFPDPPMRASTPEASGLRHLAFAVENIDACITALIDQDVDIEAIRVDEFTGARFTFFKDPDGLPLELYEVPKD